MIRCRSCLIPSSRPDTHFDATGECSACINFRARAKIDWDARRADLVRILETAPRNGSGFDCIVPSSGGKDSHYQVLTLIELGARPLIVTASTCMLTAIGRANIDNLARYATTVEVTPNRTVRAKLNRLGLDLVGDISHPEHMAIFTVPFKMAAQLGIPLLFFGECPQMEYSGPQGTETARELTARWRSEFGGFLGLRPDDLVGRAGISDADMEDYRLPPVNSDGAIVDARGEKISAYFLGQFIGPWDSRRNANVAIEHGMRCQLPSPASYWTAENQDNAQTGVHDFFGWLKYGFGRLCAQISVDIRFSRISREEALGIVRDRDGLFPETYMGVPLETVLAHIDMTREDFVAMSTRFMNRDLFVETEMAWGRHLTLKEFATCSPPG